MGFLTAEDALHISRSCHPMSHLKDSRWNYSAHKPRLDPCNGASETAPKKSKLLHHHHTKYTTAILASSAFSHPSLSSHTSPQCCKEQSSVPQDRLPAPPQHLRPSDNHSSAYEHPPSDCIQTHHRQKKARQLKRKRMHQQRLPMAKQQS